MRGRQIDAATRRALMTPEQIEAERIENERLEREYIARSRAQIDIQFHDAYRTYTTTGYNINVDAFFAPPAMQPRAPVPPPPPAALNEQLQAAIREADRCARTGDNIGRVNATNMARILRQEIMRLTSATII